MEHHRFGNSDLTVSTIGLGCYGMAGVYGPAQRRRVVAVWRFLRVRRRQHDRRASFADPTCRPRASSLKTIGLILIRVRRASGTPRAGFLLYDQSPPEPFGNRCETSEWPILDGGTDGSNPVPSSAESATRLYPQSFSQPARWDYARCGVGTAGRRRKVSRHRPAVS